MRNAAVLSGDKSNYFLLGAMELIRHGLGIVVVSFLHEVDREVLAASCVQLHSVF